MASGRICILDIDMQGVKSVKKTDINPKYIFVKPPSLKSLVRLGYSRSSFRIQTFVHAFCKFYIRNDGLAYKFCCRVKEIGRLLVAKIKQFSIEVMETLKIVTLARLAF